MALTLDALSAHTAVHLLSKENLLLVEVRCRVVHVEILEVIMLRSGPFS